MARTGMTGGSDLAYLRRESFQMILILVMGALYLWIGVLFSRNLWFNRAWLNPLPIIVGLVAAFVLQRESLSSAAISAITGITLAVSLLMWRSDLDVAPYMLVIVISLTSLLFSPRAVAGVALLCNGLVLAIGVLRFGYSPLSSKILGPILLVSAVGILSSLSVRNLYLALHWAWERAMTAQRREEELRDQQAELARTLKALDEACRRLQHLNYELAQAREAAEEARLVKQQFVTNISHELRTPLNVIVAFSEMMYLSPESYGGVPLPPEYRGDIREVYRSSQHLLRLIDDVLDLSQIEAGRMQIYLEPADLRAVITEALDIIRPLMRDKQIELRVDIPSHLPSVLMDRARIRQVVLNLLNNARRFTHRGHITVQVAQEREQIRVTVADTGIGIAPEDHHRVFEEFRQLDGTTTRCQNGSGLGLAISKRFVEMHGGRIWVESDGIPGHGSRFHFTLPLAGTKMVEKSSVHRTPVTWRRPRGRGRTVLLLDRDPAIVRMMEQALEQYLIVPVEDVSEVPKLVAELHPRAVILNPARGRQAWRQMRTLRQRLGDAAPPVILCPLVSERQMGRALGVMDYLVKPISRAALMDLLDRQGEDVRRILILDDDPRMARLLSRMIRSAPREYEVVRAYSGSEGLRKMRCQRPDLVLLDLIMPEMDGYAVLAQMRADAGLRDIPVVVITARERTPEEERRLGKGALMVTSRSGFTNEEALRYLSGLLEAAPPPFPSRLRRTGQAGQNGQEIDLRDRLVQVGGGSQ